MDRANKRRHAHEVLPGASHILGIFPAARQPILHFAEHDRENPQIGRRVTDELKTGLDLAAVAGGIGSWFALIPDVAAILSIIWLALRIWETETVKRWTGRD